MALASPDTRLADRLGAVEAALRAGDMTTAMRLSDEAAVAGADHPILLSLAGLKRMGAGENEAALPLLLRARELAPRHVGTLDALGQCLTRLGRQREAVGVFDAALAIAPDARLWFNKAMALEDASDLDAARAAFEQAVKLKPDHGEALARLAMLAVQRGDTKSARDLGTRALTCDPHEPSARIALATAALDDKDLAEAEIHVAALLQDASLSPVNLSFAHGLAGDVLDAQGKPAQAFSAYSAAKAALRSAYVSTMTGESVLTRERRLVNLFQQRVAG